MKLMSRLFGDWHKPKDPEALARALEREIQTLSPEEQEVLALREGLTCGEAAKRLGLSKEKVRQIEARALRKLRHPSRGLRRL